MNIVSMVITLKLSARKTRDFIFSFFFLKSGYTCIRGLKYTIASEINNDWSWCVE